MNSTAGQRSAGHPLFAFLALLSFMTGLVLGTLGHVGRNSPALSIEPESGALTVGRKFYRAVNVLLESGNDAELRSILASDFRQTRLAEPDRGDANRLIAELAAQASLQNDLTLTIDSITSSTNLVVATVRWSGADPAMFAGLPVETASQASFQEILRIRDDQIVEQWVDSPPQPLLNTIATVERMSFPATPVMRLWHFEPRAYQVVNSKSSLLVIGESGSLNVEVFLAEESSIRFYRSDFALSRPVKTVEVSGELVIRQGDVLVHSGGVELKISNLENDPATFFALSSESPVERHTVMAQDWGPAARSWIVASGEPGDSNAPLGTVSVGIASLREGETFVHRGLEAGSEFLISIDGGLSVRALPSQVRTIDSRGEAVSQETARIDTGIGAVILRASEVSFAPTGERTCTFLILTLVPEAS